MLAIPFFLVLDLVLLIVWVLLPWRWAWRIWAWCVLALAGLAVVELSYPWGVGEYPAVDEFIYRIQAVIWGVALGLRLIWREIRHCWASRTDEAQGSLGAADALLGAAAGLVAAGSLFIGLADELARQSVGVWVHVGFVGGALLLLPLLVQALRRRCPRCRRVAWPLAVFFGVSGSLSLAGLVYPFLIVHSATTMAAGAPHCLALGGLPRVVRSLSDLTLFSLPKNGYFHHAVMLVDRDGTLEPYHWSYWKMAFEPGIRDWGRPSGLTIACRPLADFTARLPLAPPDRDSDAAGRATLDLLFNRTLMSIPAKYSPLLDYSEGLRITVTPPTFAPALEDGDGVLASLRLDTHIQVRPQYERALTGRNLGTVAGLTAFRVASTSGDRTREWTSFVARDDATGDLTALHCIVSQNSCRHTFLRGEQEYTFSHSMDLLPQWRDMQNALVATFDGFVVEDEPRP